MPTLQMAKVNPSEVTLLTEDTVDIWTQNLSPKSILLTELLNTNQSINKSH